MRFFLFLSCLLVLVAFIVPDNNNYNKPFPPISDEFKLIWKAKTGIATFRTNVLIEKNDLIIGSNGRALMDYNYFDTGSGIYIIDRITGKVKHHFGDEVMGDMDINGVINFKNNFYFGNDNEEFLCTTREGKIIWRNPVSGDIEHEPVILKIRDKDYIVYATEEGEIQAVDPSNGTSIWTYYTPDFKGWKPGKNRNLFKVRAYFRNSTSFFTKPVVVDLNSDNVKDLVYNTFDNKLYAIDGLTGKLLWNYDDDDNLSYFTVLDQRNTEPALIVASAKFNENDLYEYSLLRFDQKGVKTVLYAGNFGNGFGLNTLQISPDKLLIPCTDSLAIYNFEKNHIEWVDRSITYLYENSLDLEKRQILESRNAIEPVVSNEFINYKGDSTCIILLSQFDPAFYQNETGVLEIISVKERKVIKRFSLPSQTELQPVITDINGDGKKDILINCRDGFTYCYELPGN